VQAAESAERFEPLLVFASLSVQLFCQCLYRQESPLVANGGASSAICRGVGRLQTRFPFLIPLRALSSGFLRAARDPSEGIRSNFSNRTLVTRSSLHRGKPSRDQESTDM